MAVMKRPKWIMDLLQSGTIDAGEMMPDTPTQETVYSRGGGKRLGQTVMSPMGTPAEYLGNTGAGEDGEVQARMPVAMMQTDGGQRMVHEQEDMSRNGDGSINVHPAWAPAQPIAAGPPQPSQSELMRAEQSQGIPGYAVGTGDEPVTVTGGGVVPVQETKVKTPSAVSPISAPAPAEGGSAVVPTVDKTPMAATAEGASPSALDTPKNVPAAAQGVGVDAGGSKTPLASGLSDVGQPVDKTPARTSEGVGVVTGTKDTPTTRRMTSLVSPTGGSVAGDGTVEVTRDARRDRTDRRLVDTTPPPAAQPIVGQMATFAPVVASTPAQEPVVATMPTSVPQVGRVASVDDQIAASGGPVTSPPPDIRVPTDTSDEARFRATRQMVLNRLTAVANGLSEVDRQIANRYLANFDAASGAAQIGLMQQITNDPSMSDGAKAVMLADMQRSFNSSRSELVGNLAADAMARAESAVTELGTLAAQGLQDAREEEAHELMMQTETGKRMAAWFQNASIQPGYNWRSDESAKAYLQQHWESQGHSGQFTEAWADQQFRTSTAGADAKVASDIKNSDWYKSLADTATLDANGNVTTWGKDFVDNNLIPFLQMQAIVGTEYGFAVDANGKTVVVDRASGDVLYPPDAVLADDTDPPDPNDPVDVQKAIEDLESGDLILSGLNSESVADYMRDHDGALPTTDVEWNEWIIKSREYTYTNDIDVDNAVDLIKASDGWDSNLSLSRPQMQMYLREHSGKIGSVSQVINWLESAGDPRNIRLFMNGSDTVPDLNSNDARLLDKIADSKQFLEKWAVLTDENEKQALLDEFGFDSKEDAEYYSSLLGDKTFSRTASYMAANPGALNSYDRTTMWDSPHVWGIRASTSLQNYANEVAGGTVNIDGKTYIVNKDIPLAFADDIKGDSHYYVQGLLVYDPRLKKWQVWTPNAITGTTHPDGDRQSNTVTAGLHDVAADNGHGIQENIAFWDSQNSGD